MPDGRLTTATILFCDLVGSTAQRTALGDDAADHLAVALDVILRDAVAQHRGSVVKSTGDGLMAVFDAASDALASAVAIQQGAELHNRALPALERIVLRIGVSAGDVQFVAHDCHGTPVVEAARLEAAADPEAIFVSGLARSLAGSRGGFEFDDAGTLSLKGLHEPVPTFRLRWEPLRPDEIATAARPAPPEAVRVPLPTRFTVSAVFVGRTRERAVLGDALQAAETDGLRRLALVSGEPGIGKTSLAGAVARDAHEAGAVVLYGRCDEDRAHPYQVWIDALSHLCASAPVDLLREHVEARGGVLARVIPELAARVDLPARVDIDRETEQYLLFGAVVDLLGRVSDRAPVVLVLDDLHWADRGSLLLLRHLLAAERSVRSLVVGIYRDSDVAGSDPLADTVASLYRELGVVRVPLAGLDAESLASFLEASAGHELGDDGLVLRDLLLAETDGNPFFVAETLRHLAETGAIARDESGRWAPTGDLRDLGLPVTVREVVRRRVARLGDAVQRVLTLASVIGREFDFDVLAAISDTDEDALLDVLDAATAAALVAPVTGDSLGERSSFVHALIEHTLYDDLLPARRRRVHRRVAEALTSLLGHDPGDRVGEIARHWIAADPASDDAFDVAMMAGRRAAAHQAPQEAVQWFGEALRVLLLHPVVDAAADARRRCELLVELGVAQRDAGEGAYRATLLEAATTAQELGATEILVAAALANTRGWASSAGAVDHERVAMLRAALEAIGPADTPERARLLATLGAETSHAGDWRERLALSDEGIAIARRVGDDDTLSYVLSRRVHSIAVPDALAGRLADTEENLALAARSANPTTRFWAAFYRVFALACAARGDEIEGLLATLDAIADDVGLPLLRWEATTQRAWYTLVTGHLDEADELTFAGLAAGTAADQPDAAIVFAAGVFLLRFDQGRLDEVVDVLAQTARDTPRIPGLRATLALAYCDLGRDDDARALLADEAGVHFARVPYDQFWLVTLTQWGLVAGHLHHEPGATVLLDLLGPWADQLAFTGAHLFGAPGHALGRCATTVGDAVAADGFFARGQAAFERLGAVSWGARLALDWGVALRERGDADALARAGALADAAAGVARAVGLRNVDDRARALLAEIT